MKKLMPLLLVVIFLASCTQTPSQKLISDANTFIKTKVVPEPDPTSYSLISTAIMDTVSAETQIRADYMIWLAKQEKLDIDIATGESNSSLLSESDTKHIEDSIQSLISNLPKGKFASVPEVIDGKKYTIDYGSVEVECKFNAKNGLGLLAPQDVILLYCPGNNTFSIKKDDDNDDN